MFKVENNGSAEANSAALDLERSTAARVYYLAKYSINRCDNGTHG